LQGAVDEKCKRRLHDSETEIEILNPRAATDQGHLYEDPNDEPQPKHTAENTSVVMAREVDFTPSCFCPCFGVTPQFEMFLFAYARAATPLLFRRPDVLVVLWLRAGHGQTS
jgi:hypothetical protein